MILSSHRGLPRRNAVPALFPHPRLCYHAIVSFARPQAAAHLGYPAVKRLYDTAAVENKLPCFNDLHPDRVADAVRAMYTMAYGYHGPGERRS